MLIVKRVTKAFAFASAVMLATAGAHAADDIVATADKAGTFKTLLAAAKAADLVDTLKGPGPLTVFAPTDEAFAKLPKGLLDELLKPQYKSALQAILKYHVVPGKVTSKDLAGKKTEAKSVEGGTIAVDATKDVLVNNAKVVKADIEASNGVVHVIDTVILPEKFRGSVK
jgi:uncharacterized surface protein with fasciclin (FAS1) repeats